MLHFILTLAVIDLTTNQTMKSRTGCRICKRTKPYSMRLYRTMIKRSGYNHKLTNQNKLISVVKIGKGTLYGSIHLSITTSQPITGRQFLNLVKKHFPRNHKVNKIFNKNKVKVSYSCMPNMKSLINMHNKKIMSANTYMTNNRSFNCINKD